MKLSKMIVEQGTKEMKKLVKDKKMKKLVKDKKMKCPDCDS